MTNSKDRITSRANPRVKEICRLKDSPSADAFLIEGKHLCDMAYEAGALLEVFALEEVGYKNVPETLVSEDVLRKIAYSPSPSKLVGIAKKPALNPTGKKTLILDRVQDPGNVGTLLRSALSFGYDEVVAFAGTANFYSPKVIMASQGAIFRLSLLEVANPLQYIKDKKKEGCLIIGSALRNATPLKETPKPSGPFALILGNEGKGIEEKILDCCDAVAKIEMEGIESLNVGVAGGILMYEL